MFQMDFSNPYVWTSLNSTLIIFILGVYVFLKNRYAILNRLYALYVFAIAQWVFFTYFLTNASLVAEDAYRWMRIGTLGGLLIAPILFIFILVFVKSKWANRIFTYVALFAVVFSLYVWALEFTPSPVEYMVRTPWGWDFTTATSLSTVAIWVWSNFLQLTGCFICWLFYKKIKDAIEKKRTLFIIIGVLIPALISLFSQVVVPLLNIQNEIISHFFRILFSSSSLILVGSIAYAISKYKLFTVLTPEIAADTIIATMTDPLIVTGPDNAIEFINNSGSKLLGYSRNELTTSQLDILLSPKKENKDKFKKEVLSKIKEKKDVTGVEIDLLGKNKKIIPTSFSGSVIRNIQGETIGIVYIARDIRDIRELISTLEIKVQARTEELEGERTNLAEKVNQRTKDLEGERRELAGKIEELEKFRKLAVGREMKMIELKDEISNLKKDLEKK